jgi:hypothetical protein
MPAHLEAVHRQFGDRRVGQDPNNPHQRRSTDKVAGERFSFRNLWLKLWRPLEDLVDHSDLPPLQDMVRRGVTNGQWRRMFRAWGLHLATPSNGLNLAALEGDRGYTSVDGRRITGGDMERFFGANVDGAARYIGIPRQLALSWSLWVLGRVPDFGDAGSTLEYVHAVAEIMSRRPVLMGINTQMSADAMAELYDLADDAQRMQEVVPEMASLYERALTARYFLSRGRSEAAHAVMRTLDAKGLYDAYDGLRQLLVGSDLSSPLTLEGQLSSAMVHRICAYTIMSLYDREADRAPSERLDKLLAGAQYHAEQAGEHLRAVDGFEGFDVGALIGSNMVLASRIQSYRNDDPGIPGGPNTRVSRGGYGGRLPVARTSAMWRGSLRAV